MPQRNLFQQHRHENYPVLNLLLPSSFSSSLWGSLGLFLVVLFILFVPRTFLFFIIRTCFFFFARPFFPFFPFLFSGAFLLFFLRTFLFVLEKHSG
jgi:hypothetical protein